MGFHICINIVDEQQNQYKEAREIRNAFSRRGYRSSLYISDAAIQNAISWLMTWQLYLY